MRRAILLAAALALLSGWQTPGSTRKLAVDGRTMRVVGSMDKSIIHRYLRRQMPTMTKCMGKSRAAPHLAFAIDRIGTVVSARASNVKSKKARRCIERVLRKTRYPPDSPGLVKVETPTKWVVK